MKIIPVILSGGSGTRLWPMSRKQYPKQYLSLIGNNSMFQETILRLSGLEELANPIIICNNDHRFLVAEQLKQIDVNNATILLEPIGKNTAPAIAASAIYTMKNNSDGILFVLSIDHLIEDIAAFHEAIITAVKHAIDGKLVAFGIVPTNANTGYGYIKSVNYFNGAYSVEEFVEKPNLQDAQSYLEQGNYFWNSGMFMFQASIFIDELATYSNDIVKSVKKSLDNSEQDLDFIRLEEEAFKSSPSDSIDYALMEKSTNVIVVPFAGGWKDIGSWSALYDIGVSDDNGNIIKGDVIARETTNSYIFAPNRMIVTIGVDDLVVIDTADVTLISSKEKAHEVKSIVDYLEVKGRDQAQSHRKVYRPWGWYDSIEKGSLFQVKRLHVKPGSKLSLQMHHKRAEHWVVIKGIASVINGNKTLTLREGESTYIKIGIKHSLENKTNESLEIIEIQSGVYLGEDDIVRFEDIYGRALKKN